MKGRILISTVCLIIATIIIIYLSFFSKEVDTMEYVPLKEYSIIKDLDSFKKDSLEKKSGKYLHNLINYKFNIFLQRDFADSLYLKQIDSMLKLRPNESRTAIVNLLKAKTMVRHNKIIASQLSLKSLEIFERNKDTTGLIQNYSLLYSLNLSHETNVTIGDAKLKKTYLDKILKLSVNSDYDLDKIYWSYAYALKQNEAPFRKNESKVKDAFNKAEKLINNNPELEFCREKLYIRISRYYFSLGDYKTAMGYVTKVFSFPIINHKETVYYCMSVLLFYDNKFEESLDYLNLADNEFRKSGIKNLTVESEYAHHRSNLYLKLKKSKDDIIKALLVQDSLREVFWNTNKNTMTFELQSKYQVDKKELEIQVKKVENFRLILVSILLCLTVVIVSILLWYNNKIKNRLTSEIQLKENIQRVISHDMLSPLVSLEMIVGRNIEKVNDKNLTAQHLTDLQKSILSEQKYIQGTKLLCQNLINWLWTDTIQTKHINQAIIKESLEEVLIGLDPFFRLNQCNVSLVIETTTADDYRFDLNAFSVVFRNLLTNTVRHAKATEIQIVLSNEKRKLCLRIYDNGEPVDEELKREIEAYVNKNVSNDFGRLGSYLIRIFLAKINARFCFENSSKKEYPNLQTVVIQLK